MQLPTPPTSVILGLRRRFALLTLHLALCTTLLAGASLAAPPAAIPWHEPSHSRRIAVGLPASRAAGLGFTGADFYRWTGFARPLAASLRLHGPDGPIALQVEERDGTGRLTAQGNGRLDEDDQVLFLAPLSPQPRTLFLYYNGPPAPPALTSPGVQVVAQPNQFYTLLLKAGDLVVGVRGGGTGLDPKRAENFGRGAIAFLSWQGLVLTDMTRSWNNYIPRAFGSGPDAPPWSPPAVLVQGPVRTVVKCRCQGYQGTRDGQATRAEITHTIALWAGCPVIDFEEDVEYTSTEFD